MEEDLKKELEQSDFVYEALKETLEKVTDDCIDKYSKVDTASVCLAVSHLFSSVIATMSLEVAEDDFDEFTKNIFEYTKDTARRTIAREKASKFDSETTN